MQIFSPKGGQKYVMDILEFPVGEGNPWADEGQMHYERTFWVHRNVGADETAYCCPAKNLGKPCPICEARNKESKKADSDDQLVKDLKPKERQLFLVYNHAEEDKGLQLMEQAHFNFGDRLDVEIRESDEDEGYDMFASHDKGEGLTLRASFKDDSFNGQAFAKCESINFKARKVELPSDVVDQVVSLDELIIIPEYDKLKAIFLQMDQDEPDDDDQDEEEKKPRRSRRGRKSDYEEDIEDDEPTDEVDDDDEQWDSEEDEDEEEEKPKRRRGGRTTTKAKRKSEPEPEPEPEEDEDWDEDWDDDEDEDEPEEEPEPAPRGRRRRR